MCEALVKISTWLPWVNWSIFCACMYINFVTFRRYQKNAIADQKLIFKLISGEPAPEELRREVALILEAQYKAKAKRHMKLSKVLDDNEDR